MPAPLALPICSPNADRPSGVRLRAVQPVTSPLPSATANITALHAVTTPAAPDPIVVRASQGDKAAFRTLYDAHRKQVARLVFRMLSSPREVDDVVQDVFVQVYRSLGDFRGQSKFTTWLHRVTVNVVLMHRRAKKSRPAEGAEPPLDFEAHQPLPDAEAGSLRRRRAFARLVESLGEKKRTVFVLHDLEGLSPVEIGEIVDAPVLTVRTRLFYARRELEALMAADPELAGVAGSFSTATAESDTKTAGHDKLVEVSPVTSSEGRGS